MASTIIRPVRTSSLRSLRPHLFPNPRDSPVQTSAATENALSGDRSIPEFGPFGQSIDNKMEAEELDIPILLIQDIPKMKYHEKPLHFMSEPGISQEQYEHMILSGTANPTEDETLTIKCPDAADGIGQVFEVKKSTLIRSPAFARFCQSDNFLPGCHMHLTFMTDPAICFKIAIYYLEEGPDRYNRTRLGVFLRTHFKTIDRFIVLGRLYFLAMRMELPGLFDMCYAVLQDYEHDMTAGYCITMASLIFARDASYDKRMKEWCMRYIRNYTLHLSQIPEWRSRVPQLGPELQHHWAKLVENNKRVIAAIEEERIGTARDDTMSLSSVEDQQRLSIRVEDRIQDLKVEEVIQEVLGEQAESDQEWEDVESLLRDEAAEANNTRTSSRLSDDKANSVLGLSPSKKKLDAIVEWHNARLKPKELGNEARSDMEMSGLLGSPEIAKARAVMGIDTQNSKLVGHKKRRFSRKVYSLLHS